MTVSGSPEQRWKVRRNDGAGLAGTTANGSPEPRHSCLPRNPTIVMPAKAGIQGFTATPLRRLRPQRAQRA